MTAINISSDIATSFTTVSDIFIDQYMPKANGEFVKVYLYLLRATGSGAGIATISEIADHFSNTEADIIRALNYWASEGILQVQTGADGQIIGVNLCSLSVSGMQAAQSNIQSAVADNAAQNNLQNSVVNNAAQNILQNSVVNNAAQNISTVNTRMHDSVVEKLKSQTPDKAASSQKEYTLDEIKEFRKNPDISELFFIIETYLKHTLSSTDQYGALLAGRASFFYRPGRISRRVLHYQRTFKPSLHEQGRSRLGRCRHKDRRPGKGRCSRSLTDLLFCNEGSRHHRPQSG